MAVWIYRCYDDGDGPPNLWQRWYTAHPEVQGKHDAIFRILETQPVWNNEHYTDNLPGGVIEVRLKGNPQWRVFGHYGIARQEFVVTIIGCTKDGSISHVGLRPSRHYVRKNWNREERMRQLANVRAELRKFSSRAYRDGFLEATIRGGIALQIRALRTKFGLSQAQFAEKLGKKQSVVSRLEDPELGKASVQSLLEIATSCDVALVVRFVSYPEFLSQTADMSPDALQVETVFESLERSTIENWANNARASGLYSALGVQEGLASETSPPRGFGESILGNQKREAQYKALQN